MSENKVRHVWKLSIIAVDKDKAKRRLFIPVLSSVIVIHISGFVIHNMILRFCRMDIERICKKGKDIQDKQREV